MTGARGRPEASPILRWRPARATTTPKHRSFTSRSSRPVTNGRSWRSTRHYEAILRSAERLEGCYPAANKKGCKRGERPVQITDVRHKSRTILEGRELAAACSCLKGIGFSEHYLSKPILGVAHSWIETMPCNFNQRRLAERV